MSRPWMPLHVADYLRDTRRLTAAEHGAYLLLIMEYWTVGNLPVDDASLARIACMLPGEWKKAKATIAAFFTSEWRHKRIDKELARASEISSKRRASAVQRYCKPDAIAEQTQSKSTANAELLDTHAGVSCSSLTSSSSLTSTATSLESKEDSAEQASGRKKQKTQLPADFKPDREMARSLGWSDAKIDNQFVQFVDSAKAHNRMYADWQAAWRNWCRSPFQPEDKNKSGTMSGMEGII